MALVSARRLTPAASRRQGYALSVRFCSRNWEVIRTDNQSPPVGSRWRGCGGFTLGGAAGGRGVPRPPAALSRSGGHPVEETQDRDEPAVVIGNRHVGPDDQRLGTVGAQAPGEAGLAV